MKKRRRAFKAAKRALEHAAQAVKEKPKRRSLSPQILVRNAKNALDPRLVSHANLNVGLFEKASVVVDAIALDKHRLNCLEGRQRSRFSDLVEMVDHRAIKLPEQFIGAKSVLGDWLFGLVGVSDEIFMRRLHGFNAGRRSQIKAKSQINHGANNGGVCDLAARATFLGKLHPPQGISFPKVDA